MNHSIGTKICRSFVVILLLSYSLFAEQPVITNTTKLADVQQVGAASTHHHGIDGDILLTKESNLVFVRQYNPETAKFLKIAELSPSDSSETSFAGSFAIDGDTIAVSGDDVVYIYAKPTNGWTTMSESAKFVSTDITYTTHDDFGFSLDISGNTIVVGIYTDLYRPEDFLAEYGYAYIVEKPIGGWSGTINQSARLIPEGDISEGHYDEVAYSVAISNDVVVVGDPYRGLAYVFEKPSNGWSSSSDIYETYTLMDSWDDDNSYGKSVDIDNGVIVVGSPEHWAVYDNGEYNSKAYLYRRNDTAWYLDQKLFPIDPVRIVELMTDTTREGQYFGGSVSISGDNIVIGSTSDNDNKGAFHLYKYSNEEWIGKKFIAFDQENSSGFGESVAISDNRVIVGNYANNETVHVFDSAIVQSVTENNINAISFSADVPEGTDLHYIIRGGDDALKFNLSEQTGLLTFKSVPDFEYPADANGDGIYELTVFIGEYDFVVSHAFVSISDIEYEGEASIDPDALKELQSIAAVDSSDHYFGEGVAIMGNIAVVGAYANDAHGPNSGLAYVYEYNSSIKRFEKISTLGNGDSEWEGQLARHIEIRDDMIILSASNSEVSQKYNAGAVYIYNKPLNGWASKPNYYESSAKIIAADTQENQFFGISISVSGDTIAIAASGDDNAKGAAYIVNKPSTGWNSTIQASIKLKAPAQRDGDRFATAISLYSDTLVVGVPEGNGGSRESGKAYLFEKPLSGWKSTNEAIVLTSSDAVAEDKFGSSVAIDENLVVVGAPHKFSKKGAAYSFKKPLSGWKNTDETAILSPDDLEADTYFGNSLSMSGTNVLIGAYQDDYSSEVNVGSAYVIKLNSNTAQVEKTVHLKNPNAQSGYIYYGKSLDISGDSVIIGTPGDGNGVVYMYKDYQKSETNPSLIMYLLN